jgi:hypothetical protein
MTFRVVRVLFCLAVVPGCLSLLAQTNFGRISGTVSDASGAVVPAVKVTITDIDTQAIRVVNTDDHGFYVAENLPIGPYAVAAEQAGFKRAEQRGLNVVADGRVTADFILQVGDSTQSVEVVEASGATLNTVSGEVAHVIDEKQVENLPLNGRAYMELLTLVPGAVVTNPDQFSVLTSLSATNQVVNGHRSNQNNMTVDGVGNLDGGSNGSLINNISPEAIGEVKIQTSNFSAEYGRSTGAAFNVVTKGGSNTYHGSLFEYFRNDALDARNFFSVNNTELRYNDFGYFLGGPIKKDKLFFTVTEEWKRLVQQSAGVRESLPTTAELQGDFSALLNPPAGTKAVTIYSPGTKTPLPGNILPASQITPDGRAIANVYQTVTPMAASFTNTPVANNAIFQLPNNLTYREDIGRLDYRINDRHTMFARWADDYNTVYLPFGPASATGSYLPITPENRDRPGKGVVLSETWVPSPNLINEAHIGASWNSQHYWNLGNTWERTTQGFAFQRVFNDVGPYVNGIPDINVQNFTKWEGPDHTLISPTTNIELNDTVSIVKGRHTIKTGVMIIRNRKDQNGRSAYDGNAVFNTSGTPNTTNYSLSDALTGNFQSYTEAAYDPMGHYRYTEPAAFVDEAWKVSRNLSINLGLRWEYMMAMYSQVDNLSEFVPSLYNPAQAVQVTANGNGLVPGIGNVYNGLVRVAGGVNPSLAYLVPNANDPAVLAVPDGAPRGMYPSRSTWAPRVGFAYALGDKTVIRGGFGIYYDRIQGNPTFYTLNNPPYVGSAQYQYANLSNITGGAAVSAPWGGINTIDPNLKVPYSQQFSFSIQRQLPLKLFADAAYVGMLGRHLLDEPDINQPSWATLSSPAVTSKTPENTIRPYVGYSTIQQFESRDTSNYNALQLQLSRRAGNVMFTAAYTFSKVLGQASSDTTNYYDGPNPQLNYGPLNYDVRHAFVGTVIFNLPRLRNHAQWVRGPLGGWILSTVLHVQSGFYNTVTGSSPIIGGRAADYLGGPVLLPNPGPNGWYNKAAFTAAPYYRWGTEGAGVAEGPGMQVYNFSLKKTFMIHERARFLFQTDFFNAFNCVNFNQPQADWSSADFGTVTAAYPPRQIQFGMRLMF